MWMIKTVDVAEHERALLFRNEQFERVLRPGRYRLVSIRPGKRIRLEKFDLTNPVFDHRLGEFLVNAHPELRQDVFEVVETGESEVAIIRINGRVREILSPAARRILWRGVHRIEVERFDIAAGFEVGDKALSLIRQLALVNRAALAETISLDEVPDGEVGLLFVNGQLDRVLAPGPHAFWKFNRTLRVFRVPTRLQTVEVAGQEILSKDKVSLRLNLTASYRVRDPVEAYRATTDYGSFLYKELQFGLREAVGGRTLDEVLAQKEELNEAVETRVRDRVAGYGLDLVSIGVKDIILPGEMKVILNRVVEAEKVAQANLIRRREETAATRALQNTAKMLEQSPILIRLKELEALEKVTYRVGSLTVLGGLDGLLEGLVKIRTDG